MKSTEELEMEQDLELLIGFCRAWNQRKSTAPPPEPEELRETEKGKEVAVGSENPSEQGQDGEKHSLEMVSKSLRMNARNSPELPASPRVHLHQRRVKSLRDLEDPTRAKYIHVHHFKSTRLFGAWFNDPSKEGKKVRLFFGSHLTAYLAARAQDRAALKYKPFALDPRSIKLNFQEEDYVADQELRDVLTCEEFGELLRKESRPKYTKMEPTPCLSAFLAIERALGNIPPADPSKEDVISLNEYLQGVMRKREQHDDNLEETNSIDGESGEDQESSEEEEMEDLVPSATQERQALTVEQKKSIERKRKAIVTALRMHRAPMAGPSKKKLAIATLPRLLWGQKRTRTKHNEEKDAPLSLNVLPEFQLRDPARNKLQYKLQKIVSTERSAKHATLANSKNLELGVDGLPHSPHHYLEVQFRSKWHYGMYKVLKSSRTNERSPKHVEGSYPKAPTTTMQLES